MVIDTSSVGILMPDKIDFRMKNVARNALETVTNLNTRGENWKM